ncbi:MAG: isochorismatase [Chloroflexi bacterium]|nr:isochorismatase [Chloroflexota bacterium]MDL1941963.1 isochorismatase [Chloroflexi bacterium CFX2]
MTETPIPSFFDPARVSEVWKVDYAARAEDARQYALQHDLKPVSASRERISVWLVDVQNTFCIPGFELFVGGHSGRGAVEDNIRLCEFIYRNLGRITHITATMDTHTAHQIFHPIFFVDKDGNHPAPYSDIHVADLREGKWKFNAALAPQFGVAPEYGQQMMIHYAETLEKKGKYALTIWPYHAMLGGIGHALVSAVEEAVFFHSIARMAPPDFEIKGNKPFTENYSVIGPEVLTGPMGETLGERNPRFIQHLHEVDRLYIAGQAKSHCVAWTIADLLDDIQATEPELAKKVHLIEDCSSPVVVPGVVDHTQAADEAYSRFAKAGMRIVKSTDEIE